MRIVHVVAGLDQTEGGPAHTLTELWAHLGKAGVEVRAYTTSAEQAEDVMVVQEGQGFTLFGARREWPRQLKRAPALRSALAREMTDADLCHNHGCWLYPNWVAAKIARQAAKPLVISPLGHLDPWSLQHHGWRKTIVRLLVEESNWRYCRAVVAKSEAEAENLRKLGLKQTIRVIPNGINPVEWQREAPPTEFLEKYPHLAGRRLLLFLSRIHPKKGLPLLLRAWREAGLRHDDWCLVVAGDHDNPHGVELRQWADEHLASGRIVFTGELDGSLKRAALAAASAFVLPSHSENFGQAVLEALAAGLPVIVTRGCPWPGIELHDCGWWVESNEVSVQKALEEAMSLSPAELRMRGARGRQWVLRDFDWKVVARQMVEFYREVLEN